LKKVSILLVDPENSHRDYLTMVLNSQGFEVFSVAGADKALNHLTNLVPDLIILDEAVNGLTPDDLSRVLQARNLDSFFIVMCRRSDLDKSMSWIMAGALACLHKPIQFDKLTQAIETGLENKEAFHEILKLTYDLKAANSELKKNQELLVKEQAALNDKTKQVRFLYQLSTDLSSTLQSQAIFDLISAALTWLIKPNLSIIISDFASQGRVRLYANRRLSPELVRRLADDLMPQLNKEQASRAIDRRFTKTLKPDRQLTRCPSHRIVLPLVVAGDKYGLLVLYFYKEPEVDIDRMLLLESVALQAAQALRNAHQHEVAVQMATRDPLTGLFNRRAFEENLQREFKRVTRYRRPMSLLMIDLDHFKSVNDRFGHQIGDEVLKTVAGVISKCTREVDFPARFGGEEFAVILPDTSQEKALLLAERIREKMKQTRLPVSENPLKLTISQGLAASNIPLVRQASDLVSLADRALYQAKEDGRNTIRTTQDLNINSRIKEASYA